jgi:hypothetical protein
MLSKLGRYIADRKKIEQLTTTGTEIQVADCGTIFMLKGDDGNNTWSSDHSFNIRGDVHRF